MPRLTPLAQIAGGLKLRSDLDLIIKSYAAGKVITDIVKTPAVEANPDEGIEAKDAVMYTVEEYLEVVKGQIAQILGDGSGVSLTSLADDIKAINEKTVADYVKITGTAAYTAPESDGADPVYTVTDNVTADVKAKLRATNTELPVYAEDNTILYNAAGSQLTYNVITGALNGVPCKLDITKSKTGTAKVYTPIPQDVTFKVFAIGDWKFSELDKDYLLDNNELQVVSYASAIDQLAIDLAKDGDLLATVQKAIGQEAIQAVIDVNFKDLNSRIASLESTSAGNNMTLAEVAAMTKTSEESDEEFEARKAAAMSKASVKSSDIATSIESRLEDNSDIKVVSQKAVATALNSLEDKVDDNDTTIRAIVEELKGETVAVQKKEIFLIPAESPVEGEEYTKYTTFNLNNQPTPVDEGKVFFAVINNMVYFEDDAFTVDREAKTVTWNFTAANGGFDITYELADKITFVFYTGVTKTFDKEKITFGNGTQIWVEEVIETPPTEPAE